MYARKKIKLQVDMIYLAKSQTSYIAIIYKC